MAMPKLHAAGHRDWSGRACAIVAGEGDDKVQLGQWLEHLWSTTRAPGNFFAMGAH
jgi:hypothetical protein